MVEVEIYSSKAHEEDTVKEEVETYNSKVEEVKEKKTGEGDVEVEEQKRGEGEQEIKDLQDNIEGLSRKIDAAEEKVLFGEASDDPTCGSGGQEGAQKGFG